MIHFEDEFVFRAWTHGIGHVSGDLRTLRTHDALVPVVSTHISWFPQDEDYNKHPQPVAGLQMRSARPVPRFFEDKQLETGDRTRERFRNAPNAFIPRGNQQVVQYRLHDQPHDPLITAVVTKPDLVINLPGMHTKVKYLHQKHGKVIDPSDPFHPEADRYRDNTLKYARTKNDAAMDRRLDDDETVYWGINLVNMARWWQEFVKDPRNGYQYVSSTHNCTGVLTACLLEGGADAYVPPPSGLIYRKPQEVSKWVAEVEETLNQLNIRTVAFLSDLHSYLNNPGTPVSDQTMVNSAFNMRDVMPLQEFKTRTSLRGEIRRDRIKEIDGAIDEYYRAGSWSAKGVFSKKLKALVTIAHNGMAYLDETIAAGSSVNTRRPGVFTLLTSVIGVIERDTSPLNLFLGSRFLSTEIDNATQFRIQFHDHALAPDDGVKAKKR